MSNDATSVRFPLPDDVVELVTQLLAEIEMGEVSSCDEAIAALRDLEVSEALAPAVEARLTDVLGPANRWIAVAPDGSNWSLLVPSGTASGEGIATTGTLIVVNQSSEQRQVSWDDLRNDPAYWLRQGARLIGTEWEDGYEYPFAFDAESWEGSRCDLAFGETDWVVRQGTHDYSFDLNYVDLRYRVPAEESQGGTGVLLTIDEGGSSMTTGEIGCTVSVDSNGAVWYYAWGCLEIYIGRPGRRLSAIDAQALVENCLDGAVLYRESIAGVESDLRDAAEVWAVVADVYGDEPSDAELTEVAVSCTDFSGTALELREHLAGLRDTDH